MSRNRFACLFALMVAASAAASEPFEHGPWTDLLTRHVVLLPGGHASRVDYAAMKADRPSLEGYLDAVSAVPRETFDGWSADARLAFLVNAYNAWTVALVLRAYPDLESIRDLGSWFRSPWERPVARLFGRAMTLDEIEHGLIRGPEGFDEPRIHFAVNCASIGCPALRPEAYTADRLDAQLASAAFAFLSDRSRNRLKDGTLYVSKIFDWYAGDFGTQGGVAAFLARHRDALGLTDAEAAQLEAGTLPVEFLPYDWRLNDTVR